MTVRVFGGGHRKEIEGALNDYVSECCRVIWCLISRPSEDGNIVLYPTRFMQSKKRKFKMVDIEFGMDTYGDLNVSDGEGVILEIAECAEMDKNQRMELFDEKVHVRERDCDAEAVHIAYCSWPSIVKVETVQNEENAESLFGRLSDTKDNAQNEKRRKFNFLTRAIVHCLPK